MSIKKAYPAAVLTFFSVLAIILLTYLGPAESVFSEIEEYDVIVDPGHGGLDGGAVSAGGTVEAPINLSISHFSREMLVFLGYRVKMTRTGAGSLDFDENASIRQNKSADLKARLKIASACPDVPFLSIHLNFFGEPWYHGAQVFCSESESSLDLGKSIQESMRKVLDKDNPREAKTAPQGIFLMDNAPSPMVTIECGFLSNPEEEKLLSLENYQKKIAVAITAGFTEYFIGGKYG